VNTCDLVRSGAEIKAADRFLPDTVAEAADLAEQNKLRRLLPSASYQHHLVEHVERRIAV